MNRNYEPLAGVQESESERGPDDLEAFIDSLTDEDLAEFVFNPMFAHMPFDRAERASAWSIKQFRKNEAGRMYRSVIRDEVRGRMPSKVSNVTVIV